MRELVIKSPGWPSFWSRLVKFCNKTCFFLKIFFLKNHFLKTTFYTPLFKITRFAIHFCFDLSFLFRVSPFNSQAGTAGAWFKRFLLVLCLTIIIVAFTFDRKSFDIRVRCVSLIGLVWTNWFNQDFPIHFGMFPNFWNFLKIQLFSCSISISTIFLIFQFQNLIV